MRNRIATEVHRLDAPERIYGVPLVSPRSARMPGLDGLRALAIAMVLLAHAGESAGFPDVAKPWAKVFGFAPDGVALFFVLSGFLITHLLLREHSTHGRIDTLAFYLRRALRILPAWLGYLIGLALLIALGVVAPVPHGDWDRALSFNVDLLMTDWHLGHLWSLSVEEKFYLLWPLMMSLAFARRGWVALVVLMLGPLCRLMFFSMGALTPYRFSIFSNADSLMIGALAAFALDRWPERLRPLFAFHPGSMRVVAFVVPVLVGVALGDGKLGMLLVPFGPTLKSLAYAYLILSAVLAPRDRFVRFLDTRPMVLLGIASYSVYLWQQLFLLPAAQGEHSAWESWPLNLVLALAAGLCAYRWIEYPVLHAKQQISALLRKPGKVASGSVVRDGRHIV